MLFDGINLVEGSEIQNLSVDTGTTFPLTPNAGELFYRTDVPNVGMYVYQGTAWVRLSERTDDPTGQLPDVITAGTYKSISVSSKGLVESGSNPTTLVDYGITDAQPVNADLTAITTLAGSAGILTKVAAGSWALDTNAYLTNNQTITLSGDATGAGTTSIPVTLSNSGVAAGAYGSASAVAYVTFDSKGRATSAANLPIVIDTSAVTSGVFANARISQSSVTQYQVQLSILETQVVDGGLIARLADNETVTGAWTFNQPVIGHMPTLSTHLATKGYVDNVAQNLTAKASVAAATAGANIILSGLQNVDGYTTETGDRILVKDQTNNTQNGVYLATPGTWVRATDMDGSITGDIAPGDTVFVENGTVNGNTTWVLIGTSVITVGTTPVVWSILSRIGGLTPTGGITLSGNNIAVATASSSRIVINANSIDLATTAVSPGTLSQVVVDAYGRVIGGTAQLPFSSISGLPTTLGGYGITNAQPLNAQLTSLANTSSTGLMSITGTGTSATRAITVSGTGLSISNGDGVAGNPVISSNASSSNVVGTIVSRDASGNFSAGTISGALTGNASTATAWQNSQSLTVAGDISGTVSGINGTTGINITLTLPTVNTNVGTFGSSAAFPVVTLNSKGQVTSASTIALSTSNVAEGSNLYFTNARAQAVISATGTGISYASGVISSNATNSNTANTLVARDASGNFSASAITATLNGNASSATTASNITGGAAGSIPYQSSVGATSMLNIGSSGSILGVSGNSLVWLAPSSVTAGNATNAANVAVSISATNSTLYPTFVANTSGNNVVDVATSLTFNPATGTLSATEFVGSGAGLINIPNAALTYSSVTVTPGAGLSGGGSVALGGTITLANTGVTNITGTTNQVIASASTGSIVLSLPQNINSGAAPTFVGTNFSNIPNGALLNNAVTIGSTGVALGASAASLAGLTSVTATSFVGALTGTASGNLPYSGGTLTGALYLASDPTVGAQAATKNYVDAAVAGLSWKTEVTCATTANITLTGEQTLDGITTASSRVLVKNQTNAAQNGIYVSGSGAWTRAVDASTGVELSGAAVYINAGTTQAATGWMVNTSGTITLGTTGVSWIQFSGSGTYAAGNGLVLSGNTFSNTGVTSNVAGTGISVSGSTGAVTINNTGVTSLAGTTNQIAVSAANGGVTLSLPSTVTISGQMTASSFSGSGAGITSIPNSALTNSTITVTAGTGLSGGGAVALGSSITLTNAGVTSAAAGTGISVSGSTGAVTITNSGVTSLVAGSNISVSGSTGAVTVAITGTVPAATTSTTATNVAGGSAGGIPYQTGTAATSFVAAGTSAQVLIGGSTPSWTNAPAIAGTNLTGTAASLSIGGSAGSVAASAITGTTLASTIVASSLTSVGTLTALTVNGTATVTTLSPTGMSLSSMGLTITAAGTTLATGFALTKQLNDITTCAAGAGVVLPNAPGAEVIVMNHGANALNVYPVSGAQIDALGTNAAFLLPVGAKIMFVQTTSTQYYTLNATYA